MSNLVVIFNPGRRRCLRSWAKFGFLGFLSEKIVFLTLTHDLLFFQIFQERKSFLLLPETILILRPKESSLIYYIGLPDTVPLRLSQVTHFLLTFSISAPSACFTQHKILRLMVPSITLFGKKTIHPVGPQHCSGHYGFRLNRFFTRVFNRVVWSRNPGFL